MAVRVTLISAAMSEAMRQARFDDDSPLDPAGLRQAREAAGGIRATGQVLVSPSVRCRETAEALGLPASARSAPGGREMGRWRGRRLDEVAAAEPGAVARWLADPEFAPDGGESLLDVLARVGTWLDALAPEAGGVVVVTEPDVVRAAVQHALGAPASAFWRFDVEPLSVTDLSGRAGRWNVRCGRLA